MIKIQDRQAFTDISVIIQMMSNSMRNKINPEFIELIEKNKDTKYVSNINKDIPLKKQNLNENTKIILALIYRDYLCPEDIRNELLKQEQKEIREKEEEIREKYEIHFKDKNIVQNTKEDKSLEIYREESFIVKIFKKLKRIFKIK